MALFSRVGATPSSRVLLYRSARLGDFINAIPALVAVRRVFPQSRIALITTTSTKAATGAAAAVSRQGSPTLPWIRFVHPTLIDEVFELEDLLREQGAGVQYKPGDPDDGIPFQRKS